MLIKEVPMATTLSVNFKKIWRICNVEEKLNLSRNRLGKLGSETNIITKAMASRDSTQLKSIRRRCEKKVVKTPSIRHSRTGMLNKRLTQ